MPYLQLQMQMLRGLLSPEQKRTLMDRFTDLLVEVEGGGDPAFRKMVWIRIDEHPPEQWQLGEMHPDAASVAGFVANRQASRGGQA